VTYTGPDRDLAIEIVNAAAAALRELGVRRTRDWAEARTRFIGDRLEEAGADLQRALRDIEAYKQDRGLTSLSSEEARVLERMSTLQEQLEQLVIERGIYTSLVDQVTREGIQPGDVQQFALLSEQELNRTVRFYYDQLLRLLEERGDQLGPMRKDANHPTVVGLDARISETQASRREISPGSREGPISRSRRAPPAAAARSTSVSRTFSNSRTRREWAFMGLPGTREARERGARTDPAGFAPTTCPEMV